MSFETYSLIEHFDFIKNFIPQPFFINNESVINISRVDNGTDVYYVIKTTDKEYTLTKQSLKKLVDSLGIKIKLLYAVCDESDVIDLALPIINKLFKCFSDCFVFYSKNDDPLNIIDVNVNDERGEEGTKYELGPSPWHNTSDKSHFTCFSDFTKKLDIEDNDISILVKSDDIMQNDSIVSINLLKCVTSTPLQPMLLFTSKFSNMSGFTDIHPVLYDRVTDITITFPMNYGKHTNNTSFNDMWDKVTHINESIDLDDYIFREINELALSDDAPNSIKTFIASLLTESDLNINQPVKNILSDCTNMMSNMKPSKKKRFSKMIGSLLGWCFVQKHVACSTCGKIHI